MSQHASVGHKLVLSRAYPAGWDRVLVGVWVLQESNQSILKEINPEYSLEGLILKLKLQYFGHLM